MTPLEGAVPQSPGSPVLRTGGGSRWGDYGIGTQARCLVTRPQGRRTSPCAASMLPWMTAAAPLALRTIRCAPRATNMACGRATIGDSRVPSRGVRLIRRAPRDHRNGWSRQCGDRAGQAARQHGCLRHGHGCQVSYRCDRTGLGVSGRTESADGDTAAKATGPSSPHAMSCGQYVTRPRVSDASYSWPVWGRHDGIEPSHATDTPARVSAPGEVRP